MMASVNWIPSIWELGMPTGEQSDDETVPAGTVVHELALDAEFNQVAPQAVSLFVVPDDLDECEEPEPFDAEEFVDRLVEDDPPTWSSTGEGGTAGVWEAPDAKTPTEVPAAKLFLHPMFAWEPSACDHEEYDAEECNQPGLDQATLIPHDPFLDTLLTPSPSSPEIVPTVTAVLANGSVPIGLGNGSELGTSGALPHRPGFFPPSGASAGTAVSVPMAPSRPSRSSWPVAAPSPARLMKSVITSLQPQHQALSISVHQQPQRAEYQQGRSTCRTGMMEKGFMDMMAVMTMAPSGIVSGAGIQDDGVLRLTGADGFSDEYDDEQHAFLRQQEVASFVGPGYLGGSGRLGLVTSATRSRLVDWLTGLHAAAPAACGDTPPLSLDALFLAVNIMDRFLSTMEGAKTALAGESALKLAAAASLALASKYEDTQPPSLWGLTVAMNMGLAGSGKGGRCSVCAGVGNNGSGCDQESGGSPSCSCAGTVGEAKRELAAMEMRVFSALKFRLTMPTALSFLGVFLRRAEGLGYLLSRRTTERVRAEAQRILQCVLRDASSLEHPASALAAAAMYWAFCTTSPGDAAPTPFAFFAVTGYEPEGLCPCLRDMEKVRTGGTRHHLASGDSLGASIIKARRDANSPDYAPQSFFSPGFGHPAIAAL